MTPYQKHVSRWKNCKRCGLHKFRQNVVLCGGGPYPLKGSIPAEILLIGEAPGDSEDMIGQPFVGPAGYLLERIMRESGVIDRRYCLTNIVACYPGGTEGKAKEPPKESIAACRPRLVEFIRLVKPRLIVLVGKLAEQHYPEESYDGTEWVPEYLWCDGQALRFCKITHPAAILRADVSQKSLMIQRSIVTLADALSSL